MTDDEKFLFKNLTMEEVRHYTKENIKDIIACGFAIDKTYILSNLQGMNPALYTNIAKIAKSITTSPT